MVAEKDVLALEKLGAAVLELGFSTERDQLEVKFRVNVFKHIRVELTEPDLTVDTLHQLATAAITKRAC